VRGQSLTWKSSRGTSSYEHPQKILLNKLAQLTEENYRLKEELALRDMYDNREYDV